MSEYAVAHLDEIDELDDGREPWRPIRHHFGITAFGVTAWTGQKVGDRIINAPLAEAGVIGVCVGAALAGSRPIGEMQFNDFVATGFNQLVNNAAKIRYRWGGSVPMVLRMPWGGLRHAGPYHSQNTEAWFYRTPGLKIVVPSTPQDARGLMAAAVADPDPVLYYEHIALYRDPAIKQALDEAPPAPISIGRAALRRAGDDLAIVSYGAYVHVGMRVAEKLAADGIQASVLDLRSLVRNDGAPVHVEPGAAKDRLGDVTRFVLPRAVRDTVRHGDHGGETRAFSHGLHPPTSVVPPPARRRRTGRDGSLTR